MADALLSAIVQYDKADPDSFVMITGVADSTCFNDDPSWDQAPAMQDRCYVGTLLIFALCRTQASWQARGARW